MATPSNRVPVRIARGSKASLDTAITAGDLKEGEVCYATDENTLYLVEGGVLTKTSADLTDVDIVNDATPQLGGDLDVNGSQIVSTAAGNIQIAPDTTGVAEFRGNTGNDAAIQLNCEANTHGVKIKSPPHSAAATYTLVLPENTGTTGQALTTDGAGVLSWATPSTVGSINDLTDVDTATAAPTNDQVLAWNGTNWVPADAATGGGGGAVDSVNGETGAVVLDLEDLDDVASAGLVLTNASSSVDINNSGQDGDWAVDLLYRYFYYYNGGSDYAKMSLLQVGDSVTLNWSDATPTVVTVDAATASSGGSADYVQFSSTAGWPTTGTVEVISGRFGPSDGQVLTWVNANSQWEPGQFPDAAATRTLLGIGEYVDDAAAGTGGVTSGAMYYNTTSSDYRLKS